MNRPLIAALITLTLALAMVGVITVFSSSAALAYVKYDGDSAYFIKKHVVNLAIALVVGAVFACLDYRLWERLAWPAMLVSLALLVVVLFVGVGSYAAPVRRWLKVGGLIFQPSEVAKFSSVMLLAQYVSRWGRPRENWECWAAPLVVTAAFGLVVVEPDFGMASLIAMTAFVMVFVGGLRLRYFAAVAAVATPILVVVGVAQKYRVARVVSYLDPWRCARGDGYQIIQSLIAIGSGGLAGKGLGCSNQKLFYLPQAHTDFAYAVLGEELGFIGAAAVVLAFAALLTVGFKIAARATDPFGRYLGVGLTSLLGFCVVINLGVVTGLMPTTGIPLPFISYGGTSLVTTFASLGCLVSIARRSRDANGFGYVQSKSTTVNLNSTFVDYV